MRPRPIPPDLDTLSPAFQALLACCRHPLTDADRVHLETCLRLPVDWNEFRSLVDRHRIHPQVLASLRQAQPGLVPAVVQDALTEKVRELTQRTLRLSADLVKILRILLEAAVPVLVLKGPPLSQLFFGDLALRTSKDLDLLVPLEHFDQAASLIQAQGYRRTQPEGDLSPRQLGRIKEVVTHFSFQHGNGTLIELHLHPDHPPGLLPEAEIHAWFAAPATIDFGGYAVPVPPRLGLLSYLCVHGSTHAWFRLKWLCDLEAILKVAQPVPWETWIAHIQLLGLERMTAEGLLLARHLLSAPLPVPLDAFVEGTPLPAGFAEHSFKELLDPAEPTEPAWSLRNTINLRRRQADLRTGWSYKLRALQGLFLTEELLCRVDLPDVLFPLYYFLRVVRWLRRRLMGN